MVNRCDDRTYELVRNGTISGPPVQISGGEYTLFVDSEVNNGTLSLQMQSPSGTWVDVRNWGLQYVRTAEYAACILALELSAGVYRLRSEGLAFNLNAWLVGNG